MESRRSILHHLGVVWRGREKELDREQLPERWVDLINYLDTQDGAACEGSRAKCEDQRRSSQDSGERS
jgi:hypothetical protein